MNIKKLFQDRILVTPELEDTVTESGIIIPGVVKENEKTHKGLVTMTGPGIPPFPMLCAPGDRVAFSSLAGVLTDINGSAQLILRQSDIICVIDPEVD